MIYIFQSGGSQQMLLKSQIVLLLSKITVCKNAVSIKLYNNALFSY